MIFFNCEYRYFRGKIHTLLENTCHVATLFRRHLLCWDTFAMHQSFSMFMYSWSWPSCFPSSCIPFFLSTCMYKLYFPTVKNLVTKIIFPRAVFTLLLITCPSLLENLAGIDDTSDWEPQLFMWSMVAQL